MDGGGNVSESSLRVIAVWLECFPEKLSWSRNEQGEVKSALSAPMDWILRFIKNYFSLFTFTVAL